MLKIIRLYALCLFLKLLVNYSEVFVILILITQALYTRNKTFYINLFNAVTTIDLGNFSIHVHTKKELSNIQIEVSAFAKTRFNLSNILIEVNPFPVRESSLAFKKEINIMFKESMFTYFKNLITIIYDLNYKIVILLNLFTNF